MSRHIPNAYDLIQQLRDTAQYHRAKAAEFDARADRIVSGYVPEGKRTAVYRNAKAREKLAHHARRRAMVAGK
jgi:hypothetical protein